MPRIRGRHLTSSASTQQCRSAPALIVGDLRRGAAYRFYLDGDALSVIFPSLAARIGPIWASAPDCIMRSCLLAMA